MEKINTFYVIKITVTFDPIIDFFCPLILTIYKKKVVIQSILWRRKTETWTFWAWSPIIAKGQTHIYIITDTRKDGKRYKHASNIGVKL